MIPPTIRHAVIIWAGAVACGVTESVLAVARAASQHGFDPAMLPQLAVRLVIYLFATLLIVQFRWGRRWARNALAALLTVLGSASMLVPAGMELVSGRTFLQAFGGGGTLGWAFMLVRLAHIACVLVASWLMFTPSANRYFTAPRVRASTTR